MLPTCLNEDRGARRSRTLRRNEKEEQEQKEDDKAINEKEKHECHDKEGSPESG